MAAKKHERILQFESRDAPNALAGMDPIAEQRPVPGTDRGKRLIHVIASASRVDLTSDGVRAQESRGQRSGSARTEAMSGRTVRKWLDRVDGYGSWDSVKPPPSR
jgi:hypothetical protein